MEAQKPNFNSQRLASLGRMLDRLDAALAGGDPSELEAAGAIHFFEVTTELAWKSVKDALHDLGLVVASPKPAWRHAVQQGWASETDGEALLRMVDKRNEFTHRCDEGLLLEVMVIATDFLPPLRRLHARLVEGVADDA